LVDLLVYHPDYLVYYTKISGLPFCYPGLPGPIFGLPCKNIAKHAQNIESTTSFPVWKDTNLTFLDVNVHYMVYKKS
jgi:hypothetical protein